MDTIIISAKTSDLFSLSLRGNDKEILDYDGYVPDGIGIGGGDYVELEIDIRTGQIIGWQPITLEDVQSALEDEEDEDDEPKTLSFEKFDAERKKLIIQIYRATAAFVEAAESRQGKLVDISAEEIKAIVGFPPEKIENDLIWHFSINGSRCMIYGSDEESQKECTWTVFGPEKMLSKLFLEYI